MPKSRKNTKRDSARIARFNSRCCICLDRTVELLADTPCCQQTLHESCLADWCRKKPEPEVSSCPDCRQLLDPFNVDEPWGPAGTAGALPSHVPKVDVYGSCSPETSTWRRAALTPHGWIGIRRWGVGLWQWPAPPSADKLLPASSPTTTRVGGFYAIRSRLTPLRSAIQGWPILIGNFVF